MGRKITDSSVNYGWLQQPNESKYDYDVFLKFRDFSPSRRSLELVQKWIDANESVDRKSDSKVSPYLARIVRKWRWVERCRQWDNHIQKRRDIKVANEAAYWEAKRLKSLSVNWDAAQSLRSKAAEMLATPVIQTETLENGVMIINKPAKWNLDTAEKFLRAARELEQDVLQAVTGTTEELTPGEKEAIQRVHDEENSDDLADDPEDSTSGTDSARAI